MNEILKKRIEREANFLTDSLNCKAFFETGAEYALAHQWISVEEALPEDEEYIIVLIAGVPIIAKGIHLKENLKDITHWMPIPKFETKERRK